MSTRVAPGHGRVDDSSAILTSNQTGRIELPPEALDDEPTEFYLSNESALDLNDDQISELAGTISRKVNADLQQFAQAMRDGKSPYEAWFDFSSGVLAVVNDIIPQAKYGGLTWRAHHDQVNARADVIINDSSGKYTDDTRNAVGYVKDQMHVPGNETDFTFADLGAVVTRAESGEELQASKLEGSEPKRKRKPEPVKLALTGDTDRDELIKRAEALANNTRFKSGHRMRVEDFIEAEKWEALAEYIVAVETDDEHKINALKVSIDERTLAEDDLESVCYELARRMDGNHLAGYLFLILNHLAASSREWNGVDSQVSAVKQWFLAYNSYAADTAADHITALALAELNKTEAEGSE